MAGTITRRINARAALAGEEFPAELPGANPPWTRCSRSSELAHIERGGTSDRIRTGDLRLPRSPFPPMTVTTPANRKRRQPGSWLEEGLSAAIRNFGDVSQAASAP